ncbi:MAG: EF-hand domain-containing protein [Thermoguttaceae bacterium]
MGPMGGMGQMNGMGGGMRGMGGGMRGMGGGMRGMGGGMGGMGGGMGPMGGMGGGMGPMGGMGGGMGGMGQMGGMGGMSSEAMQQARTQRMLSLLQSLDTNHNGMIDAEEAQGPNGQMIENILRRAGIEPKYPVSISKIQEAMNNRSRGMTGNAPASSTTEKTSEEAKPADATSTPLVPGFGEVSLKLPVVPGFGTSNSITAAGDKKTGASSDSSSASASSTSSTLSLDDRIRQHAISLMKENDTNKNGQLEKEEWSQMKEKYKAADTDHDGIITLDELTKFLIADSGSGPQSPGGTPASNAGSNSLALQGNLGSSKTNRYRSPTERAAELNLPDWFARFDADGDGEVSMSEFIKAKGDTESTAKEFASYDLDNDGIITPQEVLKVMKKK